MKIEKVTDTKYKITGLVRSNIVRDIFELFNITVHHNKDSEITLLNVSSVITFKQWEKQQKHDKIDYIQAEEIFDNFAAISLYLEKIGLQISTLDIDNLIVVNNEIFIPTNMNHLYVIKNKNITIDTPYSKNNPFLSLELQNNDKIPYSVNYKCFYSSLALLIYTKLIGSKNKNYLDSLRPIFGSRLYWLLRYCLLENPEERLIVIV